MAEKLPTYGGQALFEGVLMRGSRALAAAMRAPNGQIIVQTEMLQGIYKSPIARIPFLRGLVILWDALGLGYSYLTKSINLQAGEGEELDDKDKLKAIVLALGLFILVFIIGPTLFGDLLKHYLHFGNLAANITEGILRLVLILGYIWGIGKMPEIERVFAYHGAEHKTINAFEAGAELTPENVAKYSLEHPRCGTSFLLTLILLSIILFAALGSMPVLLRYGVRIALLPLLAGVAYEYIRWMAGHLNNSVVRWLIRPNLALQKLTTRQPSLDMLEVSIAAFNAMLALEFGQELPGPQEGNHIEEQIEQQAVDGMRTS